MDILLNAENMAKAIEVEGFRPSPDGAFIKIARAQHQRDALWLEEPCPHLAPKGALWRRFCDDCWAEFRKEVT